MRRGFRVVILGLLLFITFTPTIAHALPYNSVVYGPLTSTKDGVQNIEVGVVAFGKYDAALVALGYNGDFIHNLTADEMALLSNQETGGDFWSFAQKFTLAPDDDLMTLNGITWKSLNALYGYGNVRRGVYTQGEAANAKRDLLKILTDGSLGGGSGGVDLNTVEVNVLASNNVNTALHFKKNGVNYTSYTRYSGDSNYIKLPPKIYIKGMPSLTEFCNEHNINSEDYEWAFKLHVEKSKEDPLLSVDIYIMPKGGLYNYQELDAFGSHYKWINSYYDANNPFVYHVTGLISDFTFNGVTFTLTNITKSYSDYESYNTSPNKYLNTFQNASNGVLSKSTEPVIPPTNWPDAPETPAPTAPEVPEPSEPDLPSQPAQPTAPSLPDFPSNVISPGTTYETADIQAILDAMDEHCRHLQSAVYQGFSDYFDTYTPWLRDEFSTLRTFLREEDDWIVESISDEFTELRSYLKELAEWLADQMDFTITGGDYDDSTVVSWLKKIYYKLSGPSVNTKPVDPVGDPDGSWDWLKQLIDAILSALAGGAAALTGTLGELFQGIKDKFPFSIPWDIVAIVALLDAPPVTPSAVIEYDVFGAHVRYDIDLHFFDEQASVIRAMEDVLFCAFLLFKTDWLTGIFDGIGGFLGGKLKSTVKGA